MVHFRGVANAVWLIWLLFSIVNSFAVAILIFRRLTLTKLQKSNLEDEQRLLQNQTDGPGKKYIGKKLSFLSLSQLWEWFSI